MNQRHERGEKSQVNPGVDSTASTNTSASHDSDSHMAELVETAQFLRIDELEANPEKRQKLLHDAVSPHPHLFQGAAAITPEDVSHFNFQNGSVLGRLNLNRKDAVEKGERYVPYEEMRELHFASATFSVPRIEPGRAAFVIAEELDRYHNRMNLDGLQNVVSGVSRKAYETLCHHYGVRMSESEVIFDDNASTALFQYLGHLFGNNTDSLVQPGVGVLTFFDTGRVIPTTIMGSNPQAMKFNFKPAVDVWNNERLRDAVPALGDSLFPHMLSHFVDGKYISDNAMRDTIFDKMAGRMNEPLPEVFIIPTVTRLGRRVPFVELSRDIRAFAKALNENAWLEGKRLPYPKPPVIILDDCQGLGRTRKDRYLIGRDQSGIEKGEIASIWEYADAVMLTGAKVLGALMGSGAMLVKKQHFEEHGSPFGESVVRGRSRKFAFYSLDKKRVEEHNLHAPGVAQTPELASLTLAFQGYPSFDQYDGRVDGRMKFIRQKITEALKNIPGIGVLEPEQREDAAFVSSIVSFYLKSNSPDSGLKLKWALAVPHAEREGERAELHPEWDRKHITLPALVKDRTFEILRISLDPREVLTAEQFRRYGEKIDYLLKRIALEVPGILGGDPADDAKLQ